jgi:hypothetical protein
MPDAAARKADEGLSVALPSRLLRVVADRTGKPK